MYLLNISVDHLSDFMCETPKSPPGDYNIDTRERTKPTRTGEKCETPESPPGDYNGAPDIHAITIAIDNKCETPESPPGDYNPPPTPASP